LSSEELGELAVGYAAQDRAETAALGLSLPKTTAALQAQIDVVLVQVAAATRRIQELTEENKALRGEITLTRRQLVQQATLQPA
jgi:predicted  nucleic acid-binding Zn-ribbon protein